LCVFVFDENIIWHFGQDDQRFGFQWEALEHLDRDLQKLGGQLHVVYGNAEDQIKNIIQTHEIDAIYLNRSYSDGHIRRDQPLQRRCEYESVVWHACEDYLLYPVDDIPAYKVFTPWYKKRLPLVHDTDTSERTVKDITPISSDLSLLKDHTDHLYHKPHPHRSVNHLSTLLKQLGHIDDYSSTRNIPGDDDGTSRLSPYLSFGLVSVRQIYRILQPVLSTGIPKEKNDADHLLAELGWREFWQQIAYHWPETTNAPYRSFQPRGNHIVRENDQEKYQARCEGRTGYPIVDAGMRQLVQTNRMHGRTRMIVASFLTKDLHVDRRLGEEFFAQHLIDYDRNVNIGNRQRSASVGADPKPLRIFSPIRQAQRFDPRGEYITRWIPELQWQPIGAMMDPLKYTLQDYPAPIVDHYEMSRASKELYRTAKELSRVDTDQ
jgi:deoxyribodipyrimidine photo-lyase